MYSVLVIGHIFLFFVCLVTLFYMLGIVYFMLQSVWILLFSFKEVYFLARQISAQFFWAFFNTLKAGLKEYSSNRLALWQRGDPSFSPYWKSQVLPSLSTLAGQIQMSLNPVKALGITQHTSTLWWLFLWYLYFVLNIMSCFLYSSKSVQIWLRPGGDQKRSRLEHHLD